MNFEDIFLQGGCAECDEEGGSRSAGYIKLLMAKKAGKTVADYPKGVAREKSTKGFNGTIKLKDSERFKKHASQYASPYLIENFGRSFTKDFIEAFNDVYNRMPNLWDLKQIADNAGDAIRQAKADGEKLNFRKAFTEGQFGEFQPLTEEKKKNLKLAKELKKAKSIPKPKTPKAPKEPKPKTAKSKLSDEEQLEKLRERLKKTKSYDEEKKDKIKEQIEKLKSKIKRETEPSKPVSFKPKEEEKKPEPPKATKTVEEAKAERDRLRDERKIIEGALARVEVWAKGSTLFWNIKQKFDNPILDALVNKYKSDKIPVEEKKQGAKDELDRLQKLLKATNAKIFENIKIAGEGKGGAKKYLEYNPSKIMNTDVYARINKNVADFASPIEKIKYMKANPKTILLPKEKKARKQKLMELKLFNIDPKTVSDEAKGEVAETFDAEDIPTISGSYEKTIDPLLKDYGNGGAKKTLKGGRRLPPLPDLTLQQYYDMYGKPMIRSQFEEGPAGDEKFKLYQEGVLRSYERRKQGWSPTNWSAKDLDDRHNKIVESETKRREYENSPEGWYETQIKGQENVIEGCPWNADGSVQLDKWSGKPGDFENISKLDCFYREFYNPQTGELDSKTHTKRRRDFLDASNREVSGWEQFKRGFTGSIKTFAQPFLDVVSYVPGIGSVASALSKGIDFLPSADATYGGAKKKGF
jgi:hypothetical protein